MKSALSYLLLTVYSVLLVKPVLPFFFDFAQHIFTYKKHITTVHFENGTYHVHNELTVNIKRGKQQSADASSEKKDVSQTEFIFNEELKPTIVVGYLSLNYLKRSSNLPVIMLCSDYPPPKV